MRRSSIHLGFLFTTIAAAALIAACGGSEPAPATPADASATPPAEPAPSAEAPAPAPSAEAPAASAAPAEPAAPAAAALPMPVPSTSDLVWKDDMPTKEKAAFMKVKVLPAMTKVFQDYDAKKYATFSCKTCHGKEMKPKPSMALPELHFKAGKMAEMDTKPELVKFMHEKVVPEMAGLFGKPQFDPKTMQGFGCMGCHKVNM